MSVDLEKVLAEARGRRDEFSKLCFAPFSKPGSGRPGHPLRRGGNSSNQSYTDPSPSDAGSDTPLPPSPQIEKESLLRPLERPSHPPPPPPAEAHFTRYFQDWDVDKIREIVVLYVEQIVSPVLVKSHQDMSAAVQDIQLKMLALQKQVYTLNENGRIDVERAATTAAKQAVADTLSAATDVIHTSTLPKHHSVITNTEPEVQTSPRSVQTSIYNNERRSSLKKPATPTDIRKKLPSPTTPATHAQLPTIHLSAEESSPRGLGERKISSVYIKRVESPVSDDETDSSEDMEVGSLTQPGVGTLNIPKEVSTAPLLTAAQNLAEQTTKSRFLAVHSAKTPESSDQQMSTLNTLNSVKDSIASLKSSAASVQSVRSVRSSDQFKIGISPPSIDEASHDASNASSSGTSPMKDEEMKLHLSPSMKEQFSKYILPAALPEKESDFLGSRQTTEDGGGSSAGPSPPAGLQSGSTASNRSGVVAIDRMFGFDGFNNTTMGVYSGSAPKQGIPDILLQSETDASPTTSHAASPRTTIPALSRSNSIVPGLDFSRMHKVESLYEQSDVSDGEGKPASESFKNKRPKLRLDLVKAHQEALASEDSDDGGLNATLGGKQGGAQVRFLSPVGTPQTVGSSPSPDRFGRTYQTADMSHSPRASTLSTTSYEDDPTEI